VTALAAPLPIRLARLVRIEHTVFALPFAYVGALLAIDGWPGLGTMGWITLAMVGARTLARSLNRLIDSDLDASNPRTAGRELPAGVLTRAQVLSLGGVALAGYRRAVLQLEPIVRWLWPIPVVMFVAYPYLKRFTWLCHLWLGACLGLAPVGAWVAITGELPWQSWALGGAVCLWVAGCDLCYALFDREPDLATGLHSWATRFGVHGVFAGARAMHAGVVVLLAAAGAGLDVGPWYWLGVAVVAALLLYEHLIVRPDDLRRLDAAFFTVNGVLSIAFLAFVALDTLLWAVRHPRLSAPFGAAADRACSEPATLRASRPPVRLACARAFPSRPAALGTPQAPSGRHTSGTMPAPMRHRFGGNVNSGHRGCPRGWLCERCGACDSGDAGAARGLAVAQVARAGVDG
jgi:4-hydroxybenzoate polyprenyltransferase